MKTYIGTKIINAQPMTRKAYNELRGWTVPADENPEDEGYLVEYVDGGTANHPDFKGYISWIPNDAFERSYRPTTGMTFGMAIEAMKAGNRVARAGWNGKGMWLARVSVGSYDVGCEAAGQDPNGQRIKLLPWIGIKTADVCFGPWLASQTDMLAEDWSIVE